MNAGLSGAIAALPEPLNRRIYKLLRQGTYDDPTVDVYIAEAGDFAFLYPRPVTDYAAYKPRVQQLGLEAYKKTRRVIDQRLQHIGALFDQATTVLEVGAADGSFLAALHERATGINMIAVEPDESSAPARRALPWLRDFPSLEAACIAGIQADVVCMFHVFEHVAEPQLFLALCQRVLSPGGRLIIEVPALTDPLLSLFRTPAYEKFYFQCQHPLVYSATSLAEVLSAGGFSVRASHPYQRYGLENHLQWLLAGRPGGNAEFARVFSDVDTGYRMALEEAAQSDTIVVEAEVAL